MNLKIFTSQNDHVHNKHDKSDVKLHFSSQVLY